MMKERGFRTHLLAILCLVLPLVAGCDEKKQAAAPQANPVTSSLLRSSPEMQKRYRGADGSHDSAGQSRKCSKHNELR